MGIFRKEAPQQQVQQLPPDPQAVLQPSPIDNLPIGAASFLAQNAEIVDFALSNENLVAALKNQLRGLKIEEHWDDAKGQMVQRERQVAARIMNETGIFFVSGYVESQIFRNTMLSNLTERDIAIHNIESSCALSRHLLVHRLEYDYDRTYHDAVLDMVENILKYAAARAINRGEALSAYGSRKINEVHATDEVAKVLAGQKNKGIFG